MGGTIVIETRVLSQSLFFLVEGKHFGLVQVVIDSSTSSQSLWLLEGEIPFDWFKVVTECSSMQYKHKETHSFSADSRCVCVQWFICTLIHGFPYEG